MKTTEFIRKVEMLGVTTVEKDKTTLHIKRHEIEAANVSLEKTSYFQICGKLPRRLLNLIVDYAITDISERDDD